jgi:predicted TIM-barrel fold metal-dependent hydrolase
MLRDDIQLISVDDHIVEPAEVFTAHIEPACADVPDEEVRRVGEENARELYRFPRP